VNLPPLRRSDWSLSDEQQELRDTARQFFDRESPLDRVRAAAVDGFDADLWQHVCAVDYQGIGVPEAHGGAGGDLVDLAVVVEERGRAIAPVPLVEQVVVLRALDNLGVLDRVPGARDGTSLATFAPFRQRDTNAVLVGYAPVAQCVLGACDDTVVLVQPDAVSTVPSLGGMPVGWVDLAGTGSEVLASGPTASEAFGRALAEWKVLTAASLVGLATGALDLTVAYANERVAFGVPIGTFQALSHPLADVLTAIEGARRLVWRAAWYLEHEPDGAALHVATAWLHAVETANRAPSTGIHTQGGFGFTLESDLHLYFRRAKTWALLAGDPQAELAAIADLAFGPARVS
jgi:alkylation response protein AidB-like acyl-CoA dehydrogenase